MECMWILFPGNLDGRDVEVWIEEAGAGYSETGDRRSGGCYGERRF